VIGNAYGSADEGYFRLPDPAGRVIGMVDVSGVNGPVWNAGDISGNVTHTLEISEMPAHNHGVAGGGQGPTNDQTSLESIVISLGASGEHFHTGTTDVSGLHFHTGTTSTNGSHSHTHNANADSPGAGLVYRNSLNTRQDADNGQANEINLDTAVALVINPNGDHNHTFTSSSDGTHAHTFTTSTQPNHNHPITQSPHDHTMNPAGGSLPHNNMQPTLFFGNMFIYCGKPRVGTSPNYNVFPPNFTKRIY
jgi:microcystin-dependent protein